MPILKKSRLRPDVRDLIVERQTIQAHSIAEYLRRPENRDVDFRGLWKRVMAGNVLFFE